MHAMNAFLPPYLPGFGRQHHVEKVAYRLRWGHRLAQNNTASEKGARIKDTEAPSWRKSIVVFVPTIWRTALISLTFTSFQRGRDTSFGQEFVESFIVK
jgi:hypothetical protein